MNVTRNTFIGQKTKSSTNPIRNINGTTIGSNNYDSKKDSVVTPEISDGKSNKEEKKDEEKKNSIEEEKENEQQNSNEGSGKDINIGTAYDLEDVELKKINLDKNLCVRLISNINGTFVDIRKYYKGYPTKRGVRISNYMFQKLIELLKDSLKA